MDQRYEFVRRSVTHIVVGAGIESRLAALLHGAGMRQLVVVHDVAMRSAGRALAERLGARNLMLPNGEAAKDLAHIATAASWLRAQGAGRDVVLVGFGGGSITDATGFLASIYLRGVRFVACPTTTLALCDAALGGKNGVDFEGRKNELGTIRQPDFVAADLAWLETLPDAWHREGFVEAIKMAAVLDATAFERLEHLAPALRVRDTAAVAAAIELAIGMKMAVVASDETETGRRRWLNFGHTVGHAIESLAAGVLRHGECVAIGMLAECRAAQVPEEVSRRLAAVLASLGVSTGLPREFAPLAAVQDLVRLDKKARDGCVAMVVPDAIGHGIERELDREALARALA